MKAKKIIALATAAVMSMATMTGCGSASSTSDNANTTSNQSTTEASEAVADDTSAEAVTDTAAEVEEITLKVWIPEEEMAITEQMCDSFAEAHPEYDITFELAVMGVDESISSLTTDADAAADVFQMPSGGVAELLEAGLILPIAANLDTVKSLYGEGALKACTNGDLLYGIPVTPNCWFMYYNSDMYTEDEVQSLETMMAKDFGADTYNFSCTISNSWYLEAFFYAAGCNIFGPDGTDPNVCTWNDANGVTAATYVMDLAKNPKYLEDKDGIASTLFKEGKLGALCSGTWSAPDLKEALGDSFAACSLPTININGGDVRLSNFADYRCFSVKSNTAHPLAAQLLAEWLGNEENQLIRYKETAVSPTCLSLQEHPDLASDVATIALIAQTEYATPQPSISQINAYWTPAQALGEGIINGEITADNLQEKLDAAVVGITTKLGE